MLDEDFLVLTVELATWRRLSKGPASDIVHGEMGKWLALLALGQDYDPDKLPPDLVDEDILEALTIMKTFTTDDAERDLYRRRQDFIWTRNSELKGARAEGKAEGKAEGRSEGERARALEDARRFKALGVAIDIIAQGTGLTREEVEGV